MRIVALVADELPLDSVRIGHLFDGLDDTPHIAAQLRRDRSGISLEISMQHGADAHHQSWFTNQSVPTEILFADDLGAVALAGCEYGGHKQNFRFSQVRGTVRAAQAVVGAGVHGYDRINGLRTELAGLASWSGLSAVREDRQLNDENRLTRITVSGEAQASLTIPSDSELSFLPYFSIEYDDSNRTRVLREEVLVESRTTATEPWSTHLNRHAAIQDLISLAYWWPCAMRIRTVTRDDDPATALDGTSYGIQWLHAFVTSAGRSLPDDSRPLPANRRPLFALRDIGISGVSKWMTEYDTLGRPMWTLSAMHFQHGTAPEMQLLQVGAALEALGYRVAGEPSKPLNFVDYLGVIVQSTQRDLSTVYGADSTPKQWATAFNAA
jgi:hypothetical protein